MEINHNNFEKEVLNRVRAETSRISDNEERFRMLIEGILDYAVFTTDPDGYIESWNPGAVLLHGYSPTEAIGSHFSMLYSENSRMKDEPTEHLAQALVTGIFQGKFLCQKKNTETFLAYIYIRPIFKDGRHIGFAEIVADVNEKAKLIQDIDNARSEIKDMKLERKTRERFISTLTHDLRSPLTMARMSAELLLRKPENLSEKIHKIISYIDRTDRMIKDLLDVSKLKTGDNLPLSISLVSLNDLLKNVCEGFQIDERNKINLTFQEEISGYWDPAALQRCFENLISNALKYGDQNEPIKVSTTRVNDTISISVHNKGNLIKEEDQEVIFEQFRQIDSLQTSGRGGWGLGLTLIKGFVEALGGNVSVKSLQTEGTTFTIELPLDSRSKVSKN